MVQALADGKGKSLPIANYALPIDWQRLFFEIFPLPINGQCESLDLCAF
jgi:hypothetical protein